MSNPLDTKVISKLAEILDKSNLTELEYEDEGCRICLTRELPHPAPLPPVHPAPVPPAFAPAPAMPQPAAPAAPAPAAPVSEEDYAKLPGAVKFPLFTSPAIRIPLIMLKSATLSAPVTQFA